MTFLFLLLAVAGMLFMALASRNLNSNRPDAERNFLFGLFAGPDNFSGRGWVYSRAGMALLVLAGLVAISTAFL